MQPSVEISYDALPYENFPFPRSHPDRLATVALLAGHEPPPIDRCRVLELGCGRGGNLLPMAEALPASHFVGLDLSVRQIDEARATAAALDLGNIEFIPASILDVDTAFGQFDYILCHGVYSWVPAEVRDKILAICRHNLQPEGLAYVSYNVYPGWYPKRMVREMLLYRLQGITDPVARAGAARAYLDFLVERAETSEPTYGAELRAQASFWRTKSDTYLVHDLLETVNHPLYFHEFMQYAAGHGLGFVGETRVHVARQIALSKAADSFAAWNLSAVEREQQLDFLENSAFRQSVLCRAEAKRQPRPAVEALAQLKVLGAARPVLPNPEIDTDAPVQFVNQYEVKVTTNHRPLKAALVCLCEQWPRVMDFAELEQRVRERLAPSTGGMLAWDTEQRRQLAEAVLQSYFSAMTELHVYGPPYVLNLADRPRASPLARLQATTGVSVTNRRHHQFDVAPLDRLILQHLDGRHDRPALVDVLLEAYAQGDLTWAAEGSPPQGTAPTRAALEARLEERLQFLARRSLLVG